MSSRSKTFYTKRKFNSSVVAFSYDHSFSFPFIGKETLI